MTHSGTKVTATICCILVILSTGCHYFYDQVGEEKRIPSPVADKFPVEIEGELFRVWCGNELQIKSDYHTTYLILQGVNNPDMDEEIEQQSIDFLNSLFQEKTIRAVVVSTDERKRSIAQVYSGKSNINIAMIESGWGQYNGAKFERAQEFESAETEARSNRLGIWKE